MICSTYTFCLDVRIICGSLTGWFDFHVSIHLGTMRLTTAAAAGDRTHDFACRSPTTSHVSCLEQCRWHSRNSYSHSYDCRPRLRSAAF